MSGAGDSNNKARETSEEQARGAPLPRVGLKEKATGEPLAKAVGAAFEGGNLASPAGFKSLQRIMIEQARLSAWMWGGAAFVGLLAYAVGSSFKREANPREANPREANPRERT